jgi:hypothetical protein
MTWYIFPSRKEDRLFVLVAIATAFLIKTVVYPHLSNPYWILFMDVGDPILTVYFWFFSVIIFKEYYSDKIKELEAEAERIKAR